MGSVFKEQFNWSVAPTRSVNQTILPGRWLLIHLVSRKLVRNLNYWSPTSYQVHAILFWFFLRIVVELYSSNWLDCFERFRNRSILITLNIIIYNLSKLAILICVIIRKTCEFSVVNLKVPSPVVQDYKNRSHWFSLKNDKKAKIPIQKNTYHFYAY